MPHFRKLLFPKAALLVCLTLLLGTAGDSSALINYGDFSDIPPGCIGLFFARLAGEDKD